MEWSGIALGAMHEWTLSWRESSRLGQGALLATSSATSGHGCAFWSWSSKSLGQGRNYGEAFRNCQCIGKVTITSGIWKFPWTIKTNGTFIGMATIMIEPVVLIHWSTNFHPKFANCFLMFEYQVYEGPVWNVFLIRSKWERISPWNTMVMQRNQSLTSNVMW